MPFIPLFLAMVAFSPDSYDKLNERCYNARANYWDRFPFPQFLPSLFLKYFNPTTEKKVLDIGAGTGKVAEWLTYEGFSVLCLDPSAEMVYRLREKGLMTIQAPIQTFETDETFGAVLAILSLIHVPKRDFPTQVKKIHSSLQEKGLFVLTLLEGETEGVEEMQWGYPRFFARYTRSEVRFLLKELFEELDFKEVKSSTTYMTFFLRKI